MPRKGRFEAIEYASGFAVYDTVSGEEEWMGDGVDMLTTPSGRPIFPGSKGFLKKLKEALNSNEDETLEAYFPDVWEREDEEGEIP